MSITLHTDPTTGASHATVHNEIGETVARFFGANCAEDAQAYTTRAGMSMDDYQRQAHATAVYDPGQAQTYTILGLLGEAGEVAQLAKRAIRDNTPQSEVEAKMLMELGDCLWYLAECAGAYGWTLEAVARANVAKLAGRAARGVIHGEGGGR